MTHCYHFGHVSIIDMTIGPAMYGLLDCCTLSIQVEMWNFKYCGHWSVGHDLDLFGVT